MADELAETAPAGMCLCTTASGREYRKTGVGWVQYRCGFELSIAEKKVICEGVHGLARGDCSQAGMTQRQWLGSDGPQRSSLGWALSPPRANWKRWNGFGLACRAR